LFVKEKVSMVSKVGSIATTLSHFLSFFLKLKQTHPIWSSVYTPRGRAIAQHVQAPVKKFSILGINFGQN
jgi:hypothetical protein